jgi:ATP-dependent DNA helicase RecQ
VEEKVLTDAQYPNMTAALEVLRQRFGFSSFQKGQEEIINRLIQGQSVLAVLPTGGGKSLCYQLPAFMKSGMTIVVSPLISLMEDQVLQLWSQGLKEATWINSTLTAEEAKLRWKGVCQGVYKLLYISPERLLQSATLEKLQKCPVSYFVVDEAHCISQWGYDFRTEYTQLYQAIEALGHPTVLALTATATQKVRQDILNELRIPHADQLVYSMDRPNISIDIEYCESYEIKLQKMAERIKSQDGDGIVYVSSRQTAEHLTDDLTRMGLHGVEYYHAGLEAQDRSLIQQQFLQGHIRCMIATNAFGMGINKKDIRYVFHFHMPSSLESYVQEMGRVGRDGASGEACLFYTPGDEHIPRQFLQGEYPDSEGIQRFLHWLAEHKKTMIPVEEEALDIPLPWNQIEMLLAGAEWRGMVERVRKDTGIRLYRKGRTPGKEDHAELQLWFEQRYRHRQDKIEGMLQWIMTSHCRREALLSYFDETLTTRPQSCCLFCGIEREDRAPWTGTPQDEAFHWLNKWNQIFPPDRINQGKT